MQSATTGERSLIEIDTTDPGVKWRYTCPREHRTFEPTNGGIWCRACEMDDGIDRAHYHTIRDQREGELIDFDRVRLVDGNA